jgi:cell wall-associated NlpC family hydrolase
VGRKGRIVIVGVGFAATWLAGCGVPITAREARWREEGRPRGAPAPAVDPSLDLEASAAALGDPQRTVVQTALALLGSRDSGLDCSSVAAWAWAAAGVQLPRTVVEQLQSGEAVERDLQPGDLVFFAFRRRPADHVGVYVGGGRIVHASSAAGSVQLAALAAEPFARSRVAARRPRSPSGERAPGV